MFELKDTLSPILVSLFSLFILGQFSTVEGNTIEGKLWTYEPNVPHQTPIVVEAISIEEHTGQVTQSDVFGNYNLTGLMVGHYHLRCHGMGKFIYHQTQGKNTVFIFGRNTHLKNIDFTLAPIKKGRWQQYNYLEHGLVHQDVHVIYQAKNGILWFKTREGISLFDGEEFTTLDTVKRGFHALGGIYEDHAGVIWFGTANEGVFQYRNNQLIRFLPDSEISQVEVHDIKQGYDGEIWLASNKGLFQYKDRSITCFTTEDGLAENYVQKLLLDRFGGLWLCHGRRFMETASGSGLTYYKDNRFHVFTRKHGLPSNTVTSACQGINGDIWFGTDQGLAYYDGRSFRTYNTQNGLPTNEIVSLLMDDQQNLWIGLGQGISRFSKGSFVNYTKGDSDGLIDGAVNCIFQTVEGSIWFGTFSGALKLEDISLINYSLSDGLASNKVNTILVTEKNQLWFSSDSSEGEGLTLYDGNNFSRLKTGNGLIDRANKLVIGKDSKLWFGRMSYERTQYDGLAYLDAAEGTRHYSVADGLLGNTISALHVDSDGHLWIGSSRRAQAEGTAGLSKFNGDRFATFSMLEITGTSAEKGVQDAIRSIDSDSWGRIWLGRNYGLSCFDGSRFFHFNQEDGLVSNEIRSLLVDRDNILWLGTYYGVNRWDLNQSIANVSFQTYTTADGLSYPTIKGQIYKSRDGLVWFGTTGGGVSFFDGNSWSSLDHREGLPGNFVEGIAEDKSGNMWFVIAGNGISRYRRSDVKPIVKIVKVQIGNQVYVKNEFQSVQQVISGQRLTITYGGIDYLTHPAKRQYRYRLQGPLRDSSWSRQTTETNLDYVFNQDGTYNFEIQAINRDLRYSEPASLVFEVVPIWYMNGWIVIPSGSIIFALLILAIIYGFRYYHQRREAENLRTKMYEQERETRLSLEAELADAYQMQIALLPESDPAVSGLQISGRNIAAKEVGGDFFDYLEGREQLTVAVGDVSGKGLKGAMNAVMASGILRLASDENPASDSSVLMSKVNNSLCQSMEQDMNVTMVLAQFDLRQKQMILTNAGQHAYPLLKRGNSVEPIQAKGLALGMIPSVPYKALTLELQSGDLLLFMTDGITEPRNAEGVMYEESGRFHQITSSLSDNLNAKEVVEIIIQDVIDYMVDEEDRDDDITLVAIKVT